MMVTSPRTEEEDGRRRWVIVRGVQGKEVGADGRIARHRGYNKVGGVDHISWRFEYLI